MNASDFESVIGLEIHAQLTTETKLFSAAATEFGAPPNSHTTVVCLGMPGALPVLNRRAVELGVRAGLALGCRINLQSTFARKHYFYPDLPKGYQISQYESPLCIAGTVEANGRTVRIRRIHLEEDAGRSIHDAHPRLTLIDLNRAGTPLLEIVSEPDLRTADEAVEYLRIVRETLVAVRVNDGNLEEGNLRCDANVSVRARGATALGPRTELKNINSFRFLKEAIEFEVARQIELVQAGGTVQLQTRTFDPKRGETRAMRAKEDETDYRYFPDPDLPPLEVTAEFVDEVRASIPELPRAKRRRYAESLGLKPQTATALTTDPELTALFDACVTAGASPARTANLLLGGIAHSLHDARRTWSSVSAALVTELATALEAGTVSAAAAKAVLGEMVTSGTSALALVRARGLDVTSGSSDIDAALEAVLAAEPSNVAAFKAGQTKVLGYFVGRVMKALGGKADPKTVSERVRARLENA